MAQLYERSQVGKREDLADYISLVDAKDTPFVAMAPKGSKPGNTYLQWQADNFPATATTGTVDGTDVTSSDYQNLNSGRALLANYVQVFRRPVRVSPLSVDVSIVAGLKDELAGMVAKGITLMKRDMEATFLSANDGQADNGTNPYLTKAMGTWISTSGGSTPAVPSAFRTPSASIVGGSAASTTLDESMVQGLLTSIWGQTGTFRDYDGIVGSSVKRAFTNLLFTTSQNANTNTASSIRTFNREADAETFLSSVDVFEGDFGRIRLHPDAFMPAAYKGYVIPMDLCEIRYSSLPEVKDLPDYGGGPARLIEAVAGLVVKNPLAFGKFDFSS
jgi:hypothetical protein